LVAAQPESNDPETSRTIDTAEAEEARFMQDSQAGKWRAFLWLTAIHTCTHFTLHARADFIRVKD
jgi:hypothetical protein